MPGIRTFNPSGQGTRVTRPAIYNPIRPRSPDAAHCPRPVRRVGYQVGPGTGQILPPGILGGGGIGSNLQALLNQLGSGGTSPLQGQGPLRALLANLGFGHLPTPNTRSATLVAIADDGSQSRAVSYSYGDDMKIEVTVPSGTTPSNATPYLDNHQGTTTSWPPSAGSTLDIDLGAAPSTSGAHYVYVMVTFSDGSQAKTNQVAIAVSSSGGGGGLLPKYFTGRWNVAASPGLSLVTGNLNLTSDVASSTVGVAGDSYSLTDGDPVGADAFEPAPFSFGLGLQSIPLISGGNVPKMQARRVSSQEWFQAQAARRSRVRFALDDPVSFSHSVDWDFGDGGKDTTDNPTHTYYAGGSSYSNWIPTLSVTVTVTDNINNKSIGYSGQWGGQYGGLASKLIGRWPTDISIGSNNDVILTSKYHNGAPVSNCRVLARFKNCLHSGTGWQIYTTDSSGSTGNMYGGGDGEIYVKCLRNPSLTTCLSFGGWPCGC